MSKSYTVRIRTQIVNGVEIKWCSVPGHVNVPIAPVDVTMPVEMPTVRLVDPAADIMTYDADTKQWTTAEEQDRARLLEDEAKYTTDDESMNAFAGLGNAVAPFFVMQTHTTVAQWNAVMPEKKQADLNTPVVNVSWFDALAYCNELSKAMGRTPVYHFKGDMSDPTQILEDETANGVRLLTERQWFVATMGGTNKEFYHDKIDEMAWHYNNEKMNGSPSIKPVGQLLPNAYGLHDSQGNAWHWMLDLYDTSIDPSKP